MSKTITMMMKAPNCKMELFEIENNYKKFQGVVGGTFDIYEYYPEMNIDVIFNEEYIIKSLMPNIKFYDDFIGGVILFANINHETGSYESLTKEQINFLNENIDKISLESFVRDNKLYIIFPKEL